MGATPSSQRRQSMLDDQFHRAESALFRNQIFVDLFLPNLPATDANATYRLFRSPARLVHLSVTSHRTEYALTPRPDRACVIGHELVYTGRQTRPVLPNDGALLGRRARRRHYKNYWSEPKCMLRVRTDIGDAVRKQGLVALACVYVGARRHALLFDAEYNVLDCARFALRQSVGPATIAVHQQNIVASPAMDTCGGTTESTATSGDDTDDMDNNNKHDSSSEW